MRSLVTGGAGFLGRNLCERLLGAGHQVVCLDNLFTASPPNIAYLQALPGFTFIRHDILDPLPDLGRFDQIWHLACPASPPHYQFDPVYTTRIAFEGTLRMLEWARDQDATLLHTSTSEVYGDPPSQHHPQTESYRGNVNPIGIRSCYDEGKRVAESLCFDFIRRYGTDVRVVRIFNTYGPGMHPLDGRVVSNFIVQALRGEDLTLYGDGRQTRSLCYVDDLIEAFCRLMALDRGSDGRPFHGPVNCGNPEEFTMSQLADLVIHLVGAKVGKVHLPLPADDPLQRQPDIGLARRILGWSPRITLAEGLVPTIAYFKSLDLDAFASPTSGRVSDPPSRRTSVSSR